MYDGAYWIKEIDNTGWESKLKSCVCSACGESALSKLDHSMDGVSYKLYPSNFCPNCGEKMI